MIKLSLSLCLSLSDVKTAVSSEETEIEEMEAIKEDQKAEAIVALHDIRQTLERLQTDPKEKNAEAGLCKKRFDC
jgi:hypothetical protein